MEDRDDLVHAGPWNINGALFILHPWLPNVPLHLLDFDYVNLWVQIRGAPLEYSTPDMAVRMGSVIGFVTSVDKGLFHKKTLNICMFVSISQLLSL